MIIRVFVRGELVDRLFPLVWSYMDGRWGRVTDAMLCQAVPGTRLCIISLQSSEEGCQARRQEVGWRLVLGWGVSICKVLSMRYGHSPGRLFGGIPVFCVF